MPTAAEKHPGLYGRRWRRARLVFLSSKPLCAMCQQEGRLQVAQEVDHIIKHNGDPALFWDQSNWQGLCRFHHRSVKAQIERSGKVRGCDANGEPLDPNHPWYTQ